MKDIWEPGIPSKESVLDRLREFEELQDGWLDGDGSAPLKENLKWLYDFFQNVYPSDLPYPCLCPTFEGNVEAEWFLQNDDVDATLKFDFKTNRLDWDYYIKSTQEASFDVMNVADLYRDNNIIYYQLREWSQSDER